MASEGFACVPRPSENTFFDFLSLPLEMRTRIYKSLFRGQNLIAQRKTSSEDQGWRGEQLYSNKANLIPNILRVCRQIYEEAHDLMYLMAVVRFRNIDMEKIWPPFTGLPHSNTSTALSHRSRTLIQKISLLNCDLSRSTDLLFWLPNLRHIWLYFWEWPVSEGRPDRGCLEATVHYPEFDEDIPLAGAIDNLLSYKYDPKAREFDFDDDTAAQADEPESETSDPELGTSEPDPEPEQTDADIEGSAWVPDFGPGEPPVVCDMLSKLDQDLEKFMETMLARPHDPFIQIHVEVECPLDWGILPVIVVSPSILRSLVIADSVSSV
jgi:hypothetical protein